MCRCIYDFCVFLKACLSLLAPPHTRHPSTHQTQPPNDPHGITKEELIQTLRDVLTGTPQFAEVGLSCHMSHFVFCCDRDLVTWEDFGRHHFSKENSCSVTVSVTSHHWEAGLRCSECKVGLVADSGEESLLFSKICLWPELIFPAPRSLKIWIYSCSTVTHYN